MEEDTLAYEAAIYHIPETSLDSTRKEELYTMRTRSGLGMSTIPHKKQPKHNSFDMEEMVISDPHPLHVMPLNSKAPNFYPRPSSSRNTSMWEILVGLQATVQRQTEELNKMQHKIVSLQEEMHICKEHATQAHLEAEAHKGQIKDLQDLVQQKEKEHKRELASMQSQLTQQEQAFEEGKCKTGVELEGLKEQVANASTWVDVVKKNEKVAPTPSQLPQMTANDMHSFMQEQQEKIRRANNIVIRGIPEKENEQTASLTATAQDILREKYSMQSINLVGAHRVGRKQEEGRPRLIICTVPEPRVRALILANSSVFLKGSPIYVGEDLTPNQQAERRKKYLERKGLQRQQKGDQGQQDDPSTSPK